MFERFQQDELDTIVIASGRLAGVDLIIGKVGACSCGFTNRHKRVLKRQTMSETAKGVPVINADAGEAAALLAPETSTSQE